MLYVLDLYICVSSEKKLLYGNEEEIYDIWSECYINKKYWEGLKIEKKN